jgi:hypothetical protein
MARRFVGVIIQELEPSTMQINKPRWSSSPISIRCIPQPDGRWGAVFSFDSEPSKPAVVLLAVGERHPDRPWKPSVYEVAHRRFNR